MTLELNVLAIRKYRRSYSFWTSRGITGPTPLPLFDNNLDTMFLKSFKDCDLDRQQKYGDVYGIYSSVPALVVTRPDILEHIYIKSFSDFSASLLHGGDDVDSKNVMSQFGDDWRRARAALTPMFSAAKLRTMADVMGPCCERLNRVLDDYATSGDEFNPEHYYSLQTLDIISKCFYSLDIDVYDEKSEQIVTSAKSFFARSTATFVFLRSVFPDWICSLLGYGGQENSRMFKQLIQHAVEERKVSGENRRDFLQLLIDARQKNDDKEGRGLKDIEVMANAIVFYAAGFDSNKNAVAFVIWRLALHQNVQQKVFDEINNVLDGNLEKQVTYDDYGSMVYLEAVINETLRLNPIGSRGVRFTTSDTTIPTTNITLPKFSVILIPFYVMHRDERNFERPREFEPDRFLPENKAKIKPCTFLSFGAVG